jgi:hypothetical protein
MEHWFDRMARDAASARVSRRQILVRGARALAAGALLGGGWELARAPGARGAACGAAKAPECVDLASEAAAVARAACAVESPDERAACLAQALGVYNSALAECLNSRHAYSDCGPCDICADGRCVENCLLACRTCVPGQGCVDTCPEDQFCNRLAGDRGACSPKCPSPCLPWDPASKQCRDQCTAQNPCMACRQGICQSNCPNPADYCQPDGTCKPCSTARCEQLVNGRCVGCDPACEICQDGVCASTCADGGTCCLGECRNCCDGHCNRDTGLCTGAECTPEQTCCGGQCFDLQRDREHCGDCHTACRSGEECFQGTCRPSCRIEACPDGYMCCQTAPNTYRCVDTQTDPLHCGGCGTFCGGSQTCQNGACTGCPAGALACDPDPDNGASCCFSPDDACCHSFQYGSGQPIYQCYETSLEQCCSVNGPCAKDWTCYAGCDCCPPGTNCCKNGVCIKGPNGC